jgi:hypothetical protein
MARARRRVTIRNVTGTNPHHPQGHTEGQPDLPGVGTAETADHEALRPDDRLQHLLEHDRGEEGHREALGDHRGDVLDGEVEDDDVDEHVHDVGRRRPQGADGQSSGS